MRKLSHREAMLVQILSENKNTIVNRKDILMRIWGDDSFFNSRNLDVNITKLRDYFKEDSSIEIITIKGIGTTLLLVINIYRLQGKSIHSVLDYLISKRMAARTNSVLVRGTNI